MKTANLVTSCKIPFIKLSEWSRSVQVDAAIDYLIRAELTLTVKMASLVMDMLAPVEKGRRWKTSMRQELMV